MGYKVFAYLALACLLCASPAYGASDAARTLDEGPAAEALRAIGIRYQHGGRSPRTGFDCSGLVGHAFERAWGLALPRKSEELSAVGSPIQPSELQPGDLVFYNTRRRPYSHVGIYVGEGRFIHAPRPGQSVRMESIAAPYWRARFNGARRLQPPPT